MVETDKDRDIFLADFGVDITLQFKDESKEDVVIKGIFEDPFAVAKAGSYSLVSANPHILTKWTQDLVDLLQNDKAIVNRKTYIVEGVPISDGTGFVRIMLVPESNTDDQSDYIDPSDIYGN